MLLPLSLVSKLPSCHYLPKGVVVDAPCFQGKEIAKFISKNSKNKNKNSGCSLLLGKENCQIYFPKLKKKIKNS
jgi:hypothetical protein